MDDFRMGGKSRNFVVDPIVWAKICSEGRDNGFVSQPLSWLTGCGTWVDGCAIYDSSLKRFTLLEYR